MHPALLGLFVLEAILYGLIAYVLLRKRTPYPDTRIGYHVGEAMASQAAWEYANRAAGTVCGAVGVVFLAAGLLLWRLRAGLGLAIGALFLLSLLGAAAGVCLPMGLLRRKEG